MVPHKPRVFHRSLSPPPFLLFRILSKKKKKKYLNKSITRSTPACPYAARPCSAGLPIPTALAPNANALKISIGKKKKKKI